MSMRVLGIARITNRAAGMGDDVLDHDDVQEVARRARARFTSLVDGVVARMGASVISG